MLMNLIIFFIGLSIINVIFSTIRSIATIKGGKWIASIMNAGYFGYYNIVMFYMVSDDFSLWIKALITALCNLVGVFIVKFFEEKAEKVQLYKIEVAVKSYCSELLQEKLKNADLSYSVLDTVNNDYVKFEIFAEDKKQSSIVKDCIAEFNAKYFVSETKKL